MKIAVCIKQVPDTESRIELGPSGTDIDRAGLALLVNPYDEFAVEEALRIRERSGEGEVTVVSLACDPGLTVEPALRTCLALGADRAVLLRDEAFFGGDGFSIAVALAAALGREPYDLLLFGKQAVDDDGGAVGIQVAELLGLPHVGVVVELETDAAAGQAIARRQVEHGIEIVETPLPAVITCQKGLNEPRYPNLPGIVKAKKKPLEVLGCAELGIDPGTVGAAGAPTRRLRLEPVPPRPAGRMLEGDVETAVDELARLLDEELGVLG